MEQQLLAHQLWGEKHRRVATGRWGARRRWRSPCTSGCPSAGPSWLGCSARSRPRSRHCALLRAPRWHQLWPERTLPIRHRSRRRMKPQRRLRETNQLEHRRHLRSPRWEVALVALARVAAMGVASCSASRSVMRLVPRKVPWETRWAVLCAAVLRAAVLRAAVAAVREEASESPQRHLLPSPSHHLRRVLRRVSHPAAPPRVDSGGAQRGAVI